MKQYVLMHKDIPVLTVTLTEDNQVIKINEIVSDEHKPLNMHSEQNQEVALTEFMAHRSIPNTRQNLPSVLELFQANDALDLSIKSYQLNLSDHYWIKPVESSLSWNQINFFTNSFTDNLIFINEQDEVTVDLITPNSSVNGSLRQMWVQEENHRVLLKAGKYFKLEPFNEVFVSNILDTTNIDHVRYTLKQINGKEYVSACPIFTNHEIEFIPAWHIVKNLKKQDNKYEAFIKQCEYLHIPNYKKTLDAMIAIDYLILNDDRHWGNFGFLRNSNTLEFTGMAPIFDNGNSLWYNEYEINKHRPFHTYSSLPFTTRHNKQIKYVQNDVSDIDIQRIIEITPTLMDKIYTKHPMVSYERLEIMKDLFIKRALELEVALSHSKEKKSSIITVKKPHSDGTERTL